MRQAAPIDDPEAWKPRLASYVALGGVLCFFASLVCLVLRQPTWGTRCILAGVVVFIAAAVVWCGQQMRESLYD